ncbi:MAG TPA: hypothetical protein VNK52_07790 [Hyphomicrobiaceae bacterium]|nr:hypothetical protein [Hyphomicrobiaceae bacterium]
MRVLVLALLLFAAAKFGAHSYLYRSATEEALIAAYGARAIEACRGEATLRGLSAAAQAPAGPRDLQLLIGNPDIDVALWDFGNRNWHKRYRTPYLQLTLGSGLGRFTCAYDLLKNTTLASR